VRTSIGTIEIMWGVNHWVRISGRRGEVQRQVATKAQLADLLLEVGVPSEEAAEVAGAEWHARPSDFAFSLTRPDESPRQASGLRPWAVIPAAVVVIGVVTLLFLALYFLGLLPVGRPFPP
jgi:hypothetical protein